MATRVRNPQRFRARVHLCARSEWRVEMMRSLLLIATLGAMLAVPQVQEPDISKWAAKDMHQDFVVAADSYADAARSKEIRQSGGPVRGGAAGGRCIFSKRYEGSGARRSEHDSVGRGRPERAEISFEALSPARAANDIAHPKGPPAPSARRLPIPFPSGDSKQQGVMDKLKPFTLQSDIVPPGRTIHGCVFST